MTLFMNKLFEIEHHSILEDIEDSNTEEASEKEEIKSEEKEDEK